MSLNTLVALRIHMYFLDIRSNELFVEGYHCGFAWAISLGTDCWISARDPKIV